MNYRFFISTDKRFLDAINEIKAHNEQATEAAKEFAAEVGAKDVAYSQRFGNYVAVVFEGDPDRKLWKEVQHGWWPKKNTKVAKAIHTKLSELPKQKPYQSALEKVEIIPNFPLIVGNGYAYYPLFSFDEKTGQSFIKIPWDFSVTSKELEKYKNRDNGFDSRMDFLLWEAPEFITEVKEWEFLKAVDEIKEREK